MMTDEQDDLANLSSLNEQVATLYQAGKYSEAIPIAQEFLDLSEKALDPDHPDTAQALNNLAVLYYSLDNYAKAEPLFQRVLKIREKALGPDHPDTATALNNCLEASLAKLSDLPKISSLNEQVIELTQAGKFNEAIPVAEELVTLVEKSGPADPANASFLNHLGDLYCATGDYAKAGSLYRRALTTNERVEPLYRRVLKNIYRLFFDSRRNRLRRRISKRFSSEPVGGVMLEKQDDLAKLSSLSKQVTELHQAGKFSEAIPVAEEFLELSEMALGRDHPDTAGAANSQAVLYYSIGDYGKAEPLFQRALKIKEKGLGLDHPAIATALKNLARVYESMGDYAKAEPLYERALKIREKALGPDHPDTAAALNNLAVLYRSMGSYARAEPLLQRALKVDEKAQGPDHPDIAIDLANLAGLYEAMGGYAKAEPLYQRALKIAEKVFGPDHPDTATVLSNLAGLYHHMGDYAKAEPLLQRALKIRETVRGPNHHETSGALNNLATLYSSMGDYAKAEPLDQRALKIAEKVFGPNHPDFAIALNSRAELYHSMGDYAKAEPLYQRALKINEKTLGPNHPHTAAALNNLALLYRSLGDYAKAEPLLRRALKIREKTLDPDHPDTAQALNNLAGLYRSNGDFAKAEPLFQRALKIAEKALGPDHPNTAAALNNLAQLYRFMGDYAKAEPLYQRALKIREKALGPYHPDTAEALNNLAELYYSIGDHAKAEPLYQRALKIREKALGPDHPDTAQALNNLAALKIDLGEARDAFDLVIRAGQAEEKYLSNILSFTSEQQRLTFQKITRPYLLLATLGSAAELAQAALRLKGVVLDSLLEDRLVAEASVDPKEREIIAQLRAAKQRLMQLVLEVPKDLSEAAAQQLRTAEKEKLSMEVEQLEAVLARHVAGLGKARRALSISVRQVQAVLPKQAVLIELLRYHHFLGKTNFEDRYGAVVIPARGEPEWVPLGIAVDLEKDVKLYQKSVRGETDEPTLRYVLKALEERIWAPIENALPEDSTTVIVSPDGELSFVSFATLLTPDDRFLGERYSIRYVASGRDLLRETKPSDNPMTIVFANPDFDGQVITQATGPSSAVALRSLEMRALQSIRLDALPGTADEAAALKKRGGNGVKVFLGSNATEAELSQVSSPRVLHLATHGFFLPETELGKQANPLQQPSESPKTMLENPMHRSGLALAGAQHTFNAWSRGEVPPIENDGIVTAEEVGGLKLNGTWLVVLSACDTGSGEGRAGEGVMGLRRGFIQAGGQNLLMTLWPISDETTVEIMLDFHATAEKTRNAPEALAEVQRTWLVKLRKEFGLCEAVELAGPFIMSSQGKPW